VNDEERKRAAIGLLEHEWHALDERLRSLGAAELDRPVFAEGPGWRVRDLPTHLAWWQELAARVAEKIAAEGGAPDERGSRTFLGIDAPPDALNAQTYETWRERPMAERWDRWLSAHSRMIDAFRVLRPDQLLEPEGTGDTPMEGLKRYFAVAGLIHLRMHREHIEAALKETSTP